MSKIIISYRKDNTKSIAGRLGDYLSNRFGENTVILGTENLVRLGEDYMDAIEDRVKKCEAFIILISHQWLEGNWLNYNDDYDRIAIKAALDNKKRVMPVLIDGAQLPTLEKLPDGLSSLARRMPLSLSEDTFRIDAAKLTETLESAIQPQTSVVHNSPISNSGYANVPTTPVKIAAVNSTTYELAGADVRLAAQIIDGIIFGIIGGVIGGVIGGAISSSYNIRTYSDYYAMLGTTQLVTFVVGIIFQASILTYFWTKSGQTPGKRVMNIKVVKTDGRLLTTGESLIRCFGYYVDMISLSLGFIWILFDQKKQGWHDKMAGTVVIKAGSR